MFTLILTFYCACFLCTGKEPGHAAHAITRSGARAKAGVTAACDRAHLGKTILFEDGRSLVCQDTGGKKIRGNRVDVYVEHHEEAVKLGVVKVKGTFIK